MQTKKYTRSNIEYYAINIRDKLTDLVGAVARDGCLNLHNLNIHAEFFYAEFLNLLYGWNLINEGYSCKVRTCYKILYPRVTKRANMLYAKTISFYSGPHFATNTFWFSVFVFFSFEGDVSPGQRRFSNSRKGAQRAPGPPQRTICRRQIRHGHDLILFSDKTLQKDLRGRFTPDEAEDAGGLDARQG